jgi:tetrahydromethanopterin S-methyltransferase subunit B
MPNKRVEEQTQQAQQSQPQLKVPESILRLADKYAKLYGVSPEEALERVGQSIEKNLLPMDLITSTKPVGSLSEKVQDWLQSLLMIRSASNMGDGKEDLQLILNSINQSVESRIKSIEDKVNALIESMKSTSESKTVELIRNEVNNQLKPIVENMNKLTEIVNRIVNDTDKQKMQEVLKPINDSIAQLSQALARLEERLNALEGRQSAPTQPTSVVEQVQSLKATYEELKKAVEMLGAKVVEEKLSRDDVEKIVQEKLKSISNEELIKLAQERGFAIVGGPLPFDKAQELVREAYRKGYEEGKSDKSVDHVAQIIRDGIDSLMRIIGPGLQEAIKTWFSNPANAAKAVNAVSNVVEAAQAASSGNLVEAAKKIAETGAAGAGASQ